MPYSHSFPANGIGRIVCKDVGCEGVALLNMISSCESSDLWDIESFGTRPGQDLIRGAIGRSSSSSHCRRIDNLVRSLLDSIGARRLQIHDRMPMCLQDKDR